MVKARRTETDPHINLGGEIVSFMWLQIMILVENTSGQTREGLEAGHSVINLDRTILSTPYGVLTISIKQAIHNYPEPFIYVRHHRLHPTQIDGEFPTGVNVVLHLAYVFHTHLTFHLSILIPTSGPSIEDHGQGDPGSARSNGILTLDRHDT